MTLRILLTLTWLAGLLPSALLLAGMLWRTDWNRSDNPGGRAMVGLTGVTTATYLLSVLVLIAPDLFTGVAGSWFRILSRLAVAAVLWNLLRVFLKAQRTARRLTPPEGVRRPSTD